jgi:uncharacterized membrane protein YqjE
MDEDKGISIISVITDLVSSYVERVSDLVNLAALEAQLAVKSLVAICMLIFVISSILTAFWITLLAFIFFCLVSLDYSQMLASLVLVIINIVMLSFLFYVIYRLKNNLFFPATREQLHYHTKEEVE